MNSGGKRPKDFGASQSACLVSAEQQAPAILRIRGAHLHAFKLGRDWSDPATVAQGVDFRIENCREREERGLIKHEHCLLLLE